MKICILGAGSLGSAIGGAFALAGNDVHLVGRRAHMDAVNERGLVMVTPHGEVTARPTGHENAAGIGACDLVIVLCKAYDTEALMQRSAELVGPDTMVLSLQNGLGAEEALARAVGAEHVVAGKTYIAGMLLEPGRVQATYDCKGTYVGEVDGSMSERIRTLGAAFRDADMPCTISDRIMGVVWDKLLANVSTGAVCAITGLDYGRLYENERLMETARAAVREGMAVAHAAGVNLAFERPEDVMDAARAGLPRSFKPSMLQSLEKGRRTEVDVINGAVCAQGRAHGVPTPVNDALVACVKGIELARFGAE